MPQSMKYLCLAGSSLLLAVGLFHLSGFSWITSELAESDAPEFLQTIFPVLFIHVSIQLIGLAGLGVASIFVPASARVVAFFISVMVAGNAILAFSLDAYPPGGALLFIAVCFTVIGAKSKQAILDGCGANTIQAQAVYSARKKRRLRGR